jgi:prepilin-type N-terminal cleavage/methylation domain-containing protein
VYQLVPERVDLRGERLSGPRVVNHVVGARALSLAWHLRRDHRVRLGGGKAAIPNQSLTSHRLRGVHKDDLVHRVLESHLEEQGNVADDKRGARGFGGRDGGVPAPRDFGVDDGIEGGAFGRVAEDDLSERGAVEGASGGEHGGPPARDDGGERRGSRGDRLAGEEVRINQVGPQRGEPRGHGRLSRRNVSGQPDDAHHTIVSSCHRFRIVSRRRAFTLIEVLMVMALIGIVAGWAVSRFSASGYKMDSNVRMMQNMLIGAQQTAITRNVNVQVMFDAVNDRVRVLLDADNDGTASAGETVTYRGLDGAQFLTPTVSIDGAAEFYMTGPGAIETGNPLQRAIRIAPNGSLSGDVVVYIGTVAGRTTDLRALAITGATARTAFWSYLTGTWCRRDY